MNWLFWGLLLFTVLFIMRGARKGFVKMAVSMASMILVLVLVAKLNPRVGEFLRERTPIYGWIKGQCENVISDYLEDAGVLDEIEMAQELPLEIQIAVIESIPLPQALEKAVLENNNSEIYEELCIEQFGDYLMNYLAYCITNGIGFVMTFIIAIVLVKMILYALDLLTELPVVGFANTIAGMMLGMIQAVIWIWLLFFIITLIYNSTIGNILLEQIEANEILTILYDKNLLIQFILSVGNL